MSKQEKSIAAAGEGLYSKIKKTKKDFAGSFLTNTFSPIPDEWREDAGNIQWGKGFADQLPGRYSSALNDGAGLSFSFGGLNHEQSMKTLKLVKEDKNTADPEGRPQHIIVLKNEAGLQVTMTYTYFPEHHAAVFGGELQNIGPNPIPNIKELRSFDISFLVDQTGDPKLHTIGGGITHFVFPPMAFQRDEREFLGSLYSMMRIDSGNTGRSSDKHLPLFFVEDGEGESGIYCGLEWSSLWHIDFQRRNEAFSIVGGMDDVDITLKPGEALPIPRAMVGFYEGNIHDGQNMMRRFIGDWFPKYHGEDLTAPVTWNHAFTFEATISDEIFRRQVPVCAELGFEWMQIDWGWFAGCVQPNGMFNGVGNWNTVDPERFPNGIKPLADLVRSHGMKFCNWLDPEEAHPTSEIAREHPEWMLYIDDKVMGLVDFGLREVQDYFIEFISNRVQDWGIHKLKWDNNINPKPYWEVHESKGQKGWMQIRHIRGVYRVWEELMRHNPDLILENCSSGGRRLDLGTFARAHIHHGSDFNFHTDIIRTQISGANTVMPTHRVIHTCTWGGPDSPDTYFQSRFGGILRFSQDFASWPEDALQRVKKHIDVYKSIRHLLNKSFYPLFPQPLKRDWDGWQYHDSESGEGFLLVFRMKGDPCDPVKLYGMDDHEMYEFHDPYHDETPIHRSGLELKQLGLELLPEKDSTILMKYKLKKY